MADTPRYITASDLVEKIPENVQALLTDDGTTLSKDTEILNDAILEGEGEFESYVASKYDLPVKAEDGTVPPNVKSKIITLCKYALYQRRDAISKEIQVQYDSVIGWLKAVQAGKASIPILDTDGNVESDGELSIDVSDQSQSQFRSFV